MTTSTSVAPPSSEPRPGAQPSSEDFVFPDTNLAQAQEAQTAADQGHQPWRLDPTEVASAYGASLGWNQTTVSAIGDNTYDISPADGSMRLRLTMSQPVRHDQTGIWEIVTSTQE